MLVRFKLNQSSSFYNNILLSFLYMNICTLKFLKRHFVIL
jgi:hypothetical protein